MTTQSGINKRQPRKNLASDILGITFNSAFAGFWACSTLDSFALGDYSLAALYSVGAVINAASAHYQISSVLRNYGEE